MNEYIKYKYAYYFVKLEKILNPNNYGYKDLLFNIRDTFNIELSIYKGDHLYNENKYLLLLTLLLLLHYYFHLKEYTIIKKQNIL